jgi:hypothetical protein
MAAPAAFSDIAKAANDVRVVLFILSPLFARGVRRMDKRLAHFQC